MEGTMYSLKKLCSGSIAILLLFYFSNSIAAGVNLDRVNLQLKWSHQFQFAGYYAAQEKGFYRDVGLDVNIIPAKPGDDPVQSVLKGKADFGTGTSSLLLSRQQGYSVVVLANIFQHSALALVMKQNSSTDSVHTLVDKK
jgi:ABC-type nitrate/sulfonate/bicarbonate transport system substrate-binding protein